MKKTAYILTLFVLMLGFHPDAQASAISNTAPWFCGFETTDTAGFSQGYTNGMRLIEGTNGWYANSTNAIVQTTYFSSITSSIFTNSAMAAEIPLDVTVSNRFELTSGSNIWVQIDMLPLFYDGEDDPKVPTNMAAMLYINSNGYYTVQHTNDAGASTNWVVITNDVTASAATPAVSNTWVRLNLYHDYTTKTWDLFADYNLLMEDIHFVNTNITGFSGLNVYSGGGDPSYIDNIAVTFVKPPDLGADGGNWLPTLQANETNLSRTIAQGQNAKSQSFQIWKTGGYYNMFYTNTVIFDDPAYTNWLSIDVASGTNTGTVVITYDTSTLPANTAPYKATIRIDGEDSRFGYVVKNSGWEVEIEVHVLSGVVIGALPTMLSQKVDKGSNPTNQSFIVWNNSPPPIAPMSFTINKSATWMNLSKSSGTSTGETHTIGISFEDMSGLSDGIYVATNRIAAWYDTTDADSTTTQYIDVVVSLEIEAPTPPTGLQASDGTYTKKIAVTWNAASGASRYEIWRGNSFDEDYALMLAEVTTTSYNDNAAEAGLLYYYWIRSISAFGISGGLSAPDTGYRALSPPNGVFASAGMYTNRVRVTWSRSEGADSYELYKGITGGATTNMTRVLRSSAMSYNDTKVEQGVVYVYKVMARNSRYESALSVEETGYVLSPPANLNASNGSQVNAIRLSWSEAPSASQYEVWKSEINLKSRSSFIGNTIATSFTDVNVEAGKLYYYWVRSKNSTTTSEFSRSTDGYSAAGGVDLAVWKLVVLPNTIGKGESPSVVSFRMGNDGSVAMKNPDTATEMSFYASTTPVLDNNAVLIGSTRADVTLLVGEDKIMTVDASKLTMPTQEGDYYIFARVVPVYPSSLVDINEGNNITMRAEPIRIEGSGQLPIRAINDYDGDGISDLAVVHESGLWYVRSVDGQTILAGTPWGGPGFSTVSGDFDGDGIADLTVYADGMWFARKTTGEIVLWAENWGGVGFKPVYGVFSGTNSIRADLTVYNEHSGAWYARTSEGDVVLWDTYFGAAGYTPVFGDYTGDGQSDMAVYHEATGTWYIRTVAGKLLVWSAHMGGPGFKPVSGDFNGDGVWDLALYHEASGMWFICSLDAELLVWGEAWGGEGFSPVFGDYNGNGRSDMALYHEATGTWYIRGIDGSIILWGGLWGGPGYKPVGK